MIPLMAPEQLLLFPLKQVYLIRHAQRRTAGSKIKSTRTADTRPVSLCGDQAMARTWSKSGRHTADRAADIL